MQVRKKDIYIGSAIIAILFGIYIINDKLGGALSILDVKKVR